MADRLVPFDHPFFGRTRGGYGSSLDSDPWTRDFFKDYMGSPALGHSSSRTPSRLFDQNFGLGLADEELFPPTAFRGWYLRPRRRDVEQALGTVATPELASPTPSQSGVSEVVSTDTEFKVNLDVGQFRPDELSVKTSDNRVIVHAKHEERPDEHGIVQREFKRIYTLPKDVDPNNVRSALSADGVLTVTAPKPSLESGKERTVPIEQAPSP